MGIGPSLRRVLSTPLRDLLRNLALCAASTLVALLLAEGSLRLVGYHFTPIRFLVPETKEDWRAFHMGGNDRRLVETEPLTVFDADLLWKLNPKASRELNSRGQRGPEMRKPGPEAAFLILALGDSNTIGPLYAREHWPGYLAERIGRARPVREVQVVNAGVYGYTSYQGLKLFRALAPMKPDLVFFSFGGNDPARVRTSDADYAATVAGLSHIEWLRLGPPVFHVFYAARERLSAERPLTHRVPLADFRRNLLDFVAAARAAGARPVLLTRPYLGSSDDPSYWMTYAPAYNAETKRVAGETGALCVDVYEEFKGRADRFVDPGHFDRGGHEELADTLLRHIHVLGLVENAEAGPRGELERSELVTGWWAPEVWPDGRMGRWTRAEAVLDLVRKHDEPSLFVSFSTESPRNLTRGRIEANGQVLRVFESVNRRHEMLLDLRGVPGRVVSVRFVSETAFVPRQLSPSTDDVRTLGVFVHAARLGRDPVGLAR